MKFGRGRIVWYGSSLYLGVSFFGGGEARCWGVGVRDYEDMGEGWGVLWRLVWSAMLGIFWRCTN